MYASIEQLLHTLLFTLAGVTHDWGLAIVVFTVGIRLLLVPLSLRAAKSAIAQASISDRLRQLQQSWTGSKTELQTAQQQLMKDHGVKPVSSALLLFVQAPVFFVLYRLFRYLNHPAATILVPWVPYLTIADPFHIVPILAAVLIALGTFVTYGPSQSGKAQLLSAIVSCSVTLIVLWAAPIAVSLYYTTSGVWGTMERFFFKRLLVSKNLATAA